MAEKYRFSPWAVICANVSARRDPLVREILDNYFPFANYGKIEPVRIIRNVYEYFSNSNYKRKKRLEETVK